MSLKPKEITNEFNSSVLETADNKKGTTLSFLIKWLENVILEGEKSVSFKTNLLRWAIKADNLTMAKNQSQFIILKTREIEMLNDVHKLVLHWVDKSSNSYQRQPVDQVTLMLKSALNLVEDVPTTTSYAAFRQLAEFIADDSVEIDEKYRLRSVDDNEKLALINKHVNETPIPEGMHRLTFSANNQPKTFMNNQTFALEDHNSVPCKYSNPPSPSKSLPASSSPTETIIYPKQMQTVAKVPVPQPAGYGAPAVAAKPKVLPYTSSQLRSIQSGHNGTKSPAFAQSQISQAPTTAGNQDPTTSERFDLDTRTGSLKASTIDRNQSPFLSSALRKNDGGASTPSLPWYYQQLDNANLWSSRSGENSGRARASISERSTLNRQSIRSFFFNGNAKERDSEGEDKRTPIKKSDAGPPVRAPQPAEEPAPPYRTEQGRSRGSSTSSISSYHPDTLSIDDRSVIPSPTPAPDNGVKSSRSRSVSEVYNAELSAAAVNVRERVNDYQQLNQTFFPASSDAVKKPSQQQFPPLDIISQLRQRNSEPTGAWVERVGDRLQEYMDSSSREFDVIMRWILLCGARKETTTSSLNLSIEDIINKLTSRDEYGEGDQPKSIASMKSSREGKETLSGGTITKVGGSASGKQYK